MHPDACPLEEDTPHRGIALQCALPLDLPVGSAEAQREARRDRHRVRRLTRKAPRVPSVKRQFVSKF